MFKFLKKIKPKQLYTVADMMADIAKEQRELNALEVDLQQYIEHIQKCAKEGHDQAFFDKHHYYFKPGQESALVNSLRRMGFKVDITSYGLFVYFPKR